MPMSIYIDKIKSLWQRNPLILILIIALILRLLAIIFAKGYGMHDDHFGPIQIPYNIIQDKTFWDNRSEVQGQNISYQLAHYLLFVGLDSIGISDPQSKMFFVRLIHGLYSLLIVVFGYKLTLHISNRNAANTVGLILALLWMIPFMSVRNLVEMVSIPPLLAGTYLCIKYDKYSNLLLGGALLGVAFILRYQSILLTGGLLIVLPFIGRFKQSLLTFAGMMLAIILFVGASDLLVWGKPFASIIEYVSYNAAHGDEYTSGPWYNYILLFIGILIPPMSLLLLWGFISTWRKYSYLFIPVLFFLAFHSYYPNKQERFILTMLPHLIILCVVGFQELSGKIKLLQKRTGLIKALWIWFWLVNTVLLILFTFTYSKKSRIEPLYYLSKVEKVELVIVETGGMGIVFQPTFYLNKNIPVHLAMIDDEISKTKSEIDSIGKKPDYIILYGDTNLEERVSKFESVTSKQLSKVFTSYPSLIDDLLYRLNPGNNKNQISFVYRVD